MTPIEKMQEALFEVTKEVFGAHRFRSVCFRCLREGIETNISGQLLTPRFLTGKSEDERGEYTIIAGIEFLCRGHIDQLLCKESETIQ